MILTDINTSYLLIAGIIVGVLLSGLLYYKKGKKKNLSKVVVNNKLIENILACFEISEILSITSEVSRVRFEVKDLENVKLEELKALSTGVFISGNNVKAMFKDSADEITEELKKLI